MPRREHPLLPSNECSHSRVHPVGEPEETASVRIFRSRSEKIAAVAIVAISAVLALGLVLLRDGDADK